MITTDPDCGFIYFLSDKRFTVGNGFVVTDSCFASAEIKDWFEQPGNRTENS